MCGTKCVALLYTFGIILAISGIVLIIFQPISTQITETMQSKVALVEGTQGYKIWKDITIEFRASIFHVTNPEEVMQGALPKFVERGPYVYDEHSEKTVTRTNVETDTMEYTLKRTMYFNRDKSGNLSEEDEVTIMNPAYLGIILTMNNMFPAFVPKMGNNIPALFPNLQNIFIRGQVGNILFNGLPLVCDSKQHPELQLICTFLKNKRPPILRDTSVEGEYAYSFFNKINGTIVGSFTVNRGMRNKSELGNIKSFEGSPYSNKWYAKNCSAVKGTDALTWAPMVKRQSRVLTFVPDVCRTMHVDYKDDVVIHGLIGYRYMTSKNLWNITEDECYCPRDAKKKIDCPPKGLLDLNKCQEAPVIMSEPHFLHGESTLLSYTSGLDPVVGKHATYVVIEPLSGLPLAGYKKMQLNMKLSRLPVHLLANVSEGYFPLLWVEEGMQPNATMLASLIQTHRLLRVLSCLLWLLTSAGMFIILIAWWINSERNEINGVQNKTEVERTRKALN